MTSGSQLRQHSSLEHHFPKPEKQVVTGTIAHPRLPRCWSSTLPAMKTPSDSSPGANGTLTSVTEEQTCWQRSRNMSSVRKEGILLLREPQKPLWSSAMTEGPGASSALSNIRRVASLLWTPLLYLQNVSAELRDLMHLLKQHIIIRHRPRAVSDTDGVLPWWDRSQVDSVFPPPILAYSRVPYRVLSFLPPSVF